MANYCRNELNVWVKEGGTPEDLKRFREHCRTIPEYYREEMFSEEPVLFSFAGIVPPPRETLTENWSDWNNEHWGTSSDALYIQIHGEGEDFMEIHFETTWSPPEEWLYSAIEMYPMLGFNLFYREEGLCIAGYLPEA